jgi:hypothetical protein
MAVGDSLLSEGKIGIELSLGQVTSLIDTCPPYVQDVLLALCKIWGIQQEHDKAPEVCAELTLYIDDELRERARPIIESL